MESIKLNQSNLSGFHKAVSVPGYNRKNLSPSIVHIGLGNFHRAHQAAYLDDLLERGSVQSGVFEINLIPDTFPLGEILPAQDYLYTLITKDPRGEEKVRIVGSMLGYLNATTNRQAALERMADSQTSLITLTVTEKGYYYIKKTNEINTGDPAVQADLRNKGDPKTAAASLAAALSLRYRENRLPLTIASCDNIPTNGTVLKNCVLFFCRELYPEISSWVEDQVSFPCSMVDRITPVTTPALIKELEDHYGIVDRWPVCGEDFCQWVLEDKFKTTVPGYAEAGVQIVKDAEPYELMKMRLLNGSHSALAYPSFLMGFKMVDESTIDPLIKTFIRDRYMEEITPTLAPVPGIDLTIYKDTLIKRFSNKNIADTIRRLATDSTSKIPNFILKPLSEIIRHGGSHKAIIFALAAWTRYLEGKDEAGQTIIIEDANASFISEAARKAGSDPSGFLLAAGLEGLSQEQLRATGGELKDALELIHAKGMKKSLADFLQAK